MNTTVETSQRVAVLHGLIQKKEPGSLLLAEIVCKIFSIPKERLFMLSNEIAIKNEHKCYMYFISEMLDREPTITARHVGLHHSTVIQVLKKFNYLYPTEPDYAEKVDEYSFSTTD